MRRSGFSDEQFIGIPKEHSGYGGARRSAARPGAGVRPARAHGCTPETLVRNETLGGHAPVVAPAKTRGEGLSTKAPRAA